MQPTAAISMNTHLRQRFIEQLEEHRKIVFKVAHSYAWNADDRAELIQEISTQLWRAFPKYDATRSFSTWMYRVALNVAISQLRTSKRYAEHHVPLDDSISNSPAADHDPEMEQQITQLQQIIASCDPLNRALLLLHLDDYSNSQIGEVLGLSETNVSSKLSRLRQQLRNKLNPRTPQGAPA